MPHMNAWIERWAPHGVIAQGGMVATAHPLASRAGVDVLRAGGSAVDAAIAANACLTVVEPTSCGMGGDLFALVWDPRTRSVHGLNASGRAPRALRLEDCPRDADGTIPLRSAASWSVPGCVDGWHVLHERWGVHAWSALFDAARDAAREGFAVTPVIAREWAHAARVLGAMPGFAPVFAPNGEAPRAGTVFRNAAAARTLDVVAGGGREAFYRGPIAHDIDAFSRAHGGWLRAEDLAAQTSTWDAPVCTTYRGWTVWELPPNTQGIAALQMLNLLERFPMAEWGPRSSNYWHTFIEAKKIAFADRARWYADASQCDVPTGALVSKEYARRRLAALDPRRAALVDAPGDPHTLARGDTTYLCAADANGCMVSLIQSNYTGFGSGHVVPSLGFGLQNRGALFSLDPTHPNAAAPGKRPFHTIMPGFLTRDDHPRVAFGVMGGDMQPQGHVQIVLHLIDDAMSLQDAGDAPRVRHDGSSTPTSITMRDGGTVAVEAGFPREVLDELARRGHRLARADVGSMGGYQAVARDEASGACAGASESRKDGCALGY